jgi:RNA polymerase sigma factor (sigma-70 family)
MVEDEALKAWFIREILPLEAALTRFLRKNWRNRDDVPDLRQEIYARVYDSAREGLPLQASRFLLTVARNHLINCSRRANVVSFEQVADLESLVVVWDTVTPERHFAAREELNLLEAGLKGLPKRCREIIQLRKIEGLSQREVSQRLKITETTIEHQTIFGMRALVDYMLGGSGKIKRRAASERKDKGGRP